MPFLSVKITRAADLAASDFSFAGGKSDPYVILDLGRQSHRTRCIKNELNPVWDPPERCVFEVDDPQRAVLKARVYDLDAFNPDDLLGELVIPVAKFDMDVPMLENYALSVPAEFNSQKVSSTLQLEICLTRFDDDEKVFYVWEHESWTPGRGWNPTSNADRKQFSSYDEKTTSATFNEVAPRIPQHMEASGWEYTSKQGDANGWQYARTFAGPWSASKPPLSLVRRRLWENTARRPSGGKSPSSF